MNHKELDAHVHVAIDLTSPRNQEFKVTIKFKPKSKLVRFILPVWTPGSYKIRDHAQYLFDLNIAQDNKCIEPKRVEASAWEIEVVNLSNITIEYRIEARELTVRTCYIDPDFASISLSAAVLLIDGYRNTAYQLLVNLPSNWKAYIPLVRTKSTYYAQDYDHFVDAPLTAGEFGSEPFFVQEKKHRLVLAGKIPKKLPIEFLHHLENVCEACCQVMREEPPSGDNYLLVIQILDKAYGGLEHDNCAVIQYDWRTLAESSGYRRLLQLVGHEYFHQWNVRRLRPIEYNSYNYNKSIITDSLWFAEGITSYFDLALPMIAGITSIDEFICDLSKEITIVLSTPGSSYQTIADSSREAWIKLYNSTIVSSSTQVNYYHFGAILAFCLDIRLRKVNSSLSAFLRTIWHIYGKTGRGYSRSDIKQELSYIDNNLSEELDLWLDGKNTLPLDNSINLVGMTLEQSPLKKIYTGLVTTDKESYFLVKRVDRDSPASNAGLIVNDEIIAVNNFRIKHSNDIDNLIIPEQKSLITYSRQGLVKQSYLFADTINEKKWHLKVDSKAHESCSALRQEWLKII
ncbi:M61 family metallopeptidase [Prochlorococcus sp. MIT 1307]|uniref:M61 family metallopeptidase n=1 Tax=Prochlorococcus sp. MIT 1307 TaxID=3096219 RepID=UPI002A758906|nr:PDZ domain-containing protein [Prochlorococcus sp. MIT 1307]